MMHSPVVHVAKISFFRNTRLTITEIRTILTTAIRKFVINCVDIPTILHFAVSVNFDDTIWGMVRAYRKNCPIKEREPWLFLGGENTPSVVSTGAAHGEVDGIEADAFTAAARAGARLKDNT